MMFFFVSSYSLCFKLYYFWWNYKHACFSFLSICTEYIFFYPPFQRRQQHPTPVLLPGKSHGRRSLGRLWSMGSQRVGHDSATSLSLFTCMHWRRKWQPTPVSLPGESQDGGVWWAAVYGVTQSQTRMKWLSSSSSSIPHF